MYKAAFAQGEQNGLYKDQLWKVIEGLAGLISSSLVGHQTVAQWIWRLQGLLIQRMQVVADNKLSLSQKVQKRTSRETRTVMWNPTSFKVSLQGPEGSAIHV